MSDLTRDDLTDLRDTLTDRMEAGFLQITNRLDTMNGRVSKNEQDIAVLKDRSEQNRIHSNAAKAEGRSAGQLWGGLVGGVAAIGEAFHWYFTR